MRGTVETAQANVTVNGVVASISNRSYLAENIPLTAGDNVITVVGTDAVGNTGQTSIVINFQILAGQHLSLVSGQNQTAGINEALTAPLVVQVMDDNNQGVANKNVVFRVIQGSGILDMGSSQEGRGVLVQTDANGFAQTTFELGQRSGTGNHKVRARVVGYDDEVVFYASATANIGNKLSINSGNNQRSGIHQPLPAPFIVAVTDDGANVVTGARVQFEVTQGGGHFQNDQTSYEIQTDSDGRASAHLTLGGVTGLDRQTITATLIDAPLE